ncbi:MAG TPA: hypothetical protein VIP54_05230 [Microterricola sp.]
MPAFCRLHRTPDGTARVEIGWNRGAPAESSRNAAARAGKMG